MSNAVAMIGEQDVRTVASAQGGTEIGQLGMTPDGKTYRYALAAATALDPGKLCVNADVDTDVVNKTVAATVAAGSFSVVLDAAGAVTLDFYKGGYLTVNDATGEGINYYVEGNTATTGAAEMTVSLSEPLKVGLTVDVSEVTLTQHPYAGIVISATDQADMPVGVPNVTVALSSYAWVQTGGACSVLWDEAVAKGLALTTGTGVAGAVEALDAAGEPQIGIASQAGVDTEYQTAWLTLN